MLRTTVRNTLGNILKKSATHTTHRPFHSSAICLQKLSTRVSELYTTYGYQPIYNCAQLNFCSFLDSINSRLKNTDNIKKILDAVPQSELREIFCDTKELNQLYWRPHILPLLLKYLGEDHVGQLYRSVDDLIILHRILGKRGWDFLPISIFNEVIDTQSKLSKVTKQLYLYPNEFCSKEDFLQNYIGIARLKSLILKEEDDKNDITPVLSWIFEELYLGNHNKKEMNNFLCWLTPQSFSDLISNFQQVKQILNFFRFNVQDLITSIPKSHLHVNSINEFGELLSLIRNAELLFKIFSPQDIDNLVIKLIAENPTLKFLQYKETLPHAVLEAVPNKVLYNYGSLDYFEKTIRLLNDSDNEILPTNQSMKM